MKQDNEKAGAVEPMVNSMIGKIIQFSNRMVMVFDKNGEQMPEYQGLRSSVIGKLKDADTASAEFMIGSWHQGLVPINREQFFLDGWN